jgi:hypothetical protein
MPDGSIGTRVPSEFLGKARSFRAKIATADDLVNVILERLYEPLAALSSAPVTPTAVQRCETA